MRQTFYTLRDLVYMIQEDASSIPNFPNHLSNLYNQLLSLPEQEKKRDRMIVVFPYYDLDDRDKIEVMWDVALFQTKVEDFKYLTRESFYDLLLQDWSELLDVVVSPVSFDYLDDYKILELILDEMTAFGYDYATVRKSQQAFIKDLQERVEEAQAHPECLVSLEDFYEELGISEDTAGENEKYRKKLEECQRRSEEKFDEYKRKHFEMITKFRGD